jgi:hypothetical protein
MPKPKITHSEQACHVHLKGDKNNPEPITVVVEFPGGHVEITRCSNNRDYWAHLSIDEGAKILDSRQAYDHDTYMKRQKENKLPIHKLEDGQAITQLAVQVRK